MGCHTWFARPMTNDEFELMKEYCVQEAEELYGDTSENRQYAFLRIFDRAVFAVRLSPEKCKP